MLFPLRYAEHAVSVEASDNSGGSTIGNIDVIGSGMGLKVHSVAVNRTKKAHFDSELTSEPIIKGDKSTGAKKSDRLGA